MTKKNDKMATSSPTSVFCFPLPLPRINGGSYPARNKLLTHLELSGRQGRIGAWVESMKASSPTSTISPHSDDENYNTWMKQHPSALSKFDRITAAAKGKKVVVFLDYDGTLSPIVDDPDRAFMSDAMRASVREVATCFPTAIVSGRAIDKVYNFVRLGELYYAGSHGMDIRGPTIGTKNTKAQVAQAKTILFQPASEFQMMIDKVYKELLEKTMSTPGARVEDNKFCVSVHFRCVDEKRWSSLAEQVKSVLKDYKKLRLTPGKKVLEIRPIIEWDKGRALEFLLETLGFADRNDVFPVYIGDDRTDEDAFKVLRDREQGCGILVSKFPKCTCAFYSLKEPMEVMDFLYRLVEWKRLSHREHRAT